MTISKTHKRTYVEAGVDTEGEDLALKRLTQRVRNTWPATPGLGAVKLDIGFFANVIDLGGIGLAISTDGVGTKAIIAQMMEKYDTIGIDCVAMNVNDILCVGSRPISMVDYLAIQKADPDMVDQISKGLCEGARMANISITGGEMAQMKDVVKGFKEGIGFDLAGTAVGTVQLDKIIVGQDVQPGDVVIGIESNGIHSNGLTLARTIFFEENNCAIDAKFSGIEHGLGDELLRPTFIYVKEVLEILDAGVPVKALIHITSDGLLNLTRVVADVGYIVEDLLPAPAIFSLIQDLGSVSDEEMFMVYNMGVGFCIVVPESETRRVLSILESNGRKAQRIGHVVPDDQRRVWIRPKKLVGKNNRFFKDEQ
jgi:phosphoribosylformylglycinamidine cyclo-ligase